LSDGSSTTGIPDPRPLMSSLFNAECHFVGAEQPLLGGRDFLTSLVAVVSNYAQEFLSGIQHPVSPTATADNLVSLTKGDREHIHYLQTQPDSTSADDKPQQIKLSTIQLFDLLEAIDQFLADRRTLPDIMVPLRPVTKAIAQPISAQATPIGLGLASLVVASLIGYALPSPQVPAPKFVNPAAVVTPKTAPAGKDSPKPTSSPTPAPTSAIPSKTGSITEATQVGFLERKLRRDLHQNWQERARIKQDANVNVNVNQDGQIVSYQPIGQTVKSAIDLTPLPKLTTQSTNPNQAIGSFNVKFSPTGTIKVKPAGALQADRNPGKQITDPKLTTTLATQLQAKLQGNGKPTCSQNLKYRVAVTKTGEIVDYESKDRVADSSELKTPLPKLVKFDPQAAISQEPLAQYDVVFQPNGKVKVKPNSIDKGF
jgi:hypothetical protein